MGDKVLLTVEERRVIGKKVAQLRKEGYVPAVVYGHGVEATAVMAPGKIAEKVWHDAGKHHVIELTMGNETRLAMIKSADLDPVKRRLRHLSLHVVKQNEKVQTEVPVHIKGEGETEAEKGGLVVLKTIEVVEVSAYPRHLPDAVEVPGEKLVAAGDSVTVADILPIEGVEILTPADIVVASAYEPSALAAQNEAAAGDATAETEVEAENGEAPAPAEGEEASDTKEEKK